MLRWGGAVVIDRLRLHLGVLMAYRGHVGDGGAWGDFEAQAEALASQVRRCFERHRHAVLATLRADGSPRLSGLEAPIRDGHLWLGTAPTTRIASDLGRDQRFALHSAPDSEELPEGDARVEGLARPATAEETTLFIAGHRFAVEDPTSIALFTARLVRVVLTRVDGDRLLVEHWTPEHGHRTNVRT